MTSLMGMGNILRKNASKARLDYETIQEQEEATEASNFTKPNPSKRQSPSPPPQMMTMMATTT